MRQLTTRALALCTLLACLAVGASAQTPPAAEAPTRGATPAVAGNLYGLDEVQRQLREQREQIELLRAAMKEQARLIEQLRARVEQSEVTAATVAPAGRAAAVRDAAYTPSAAGGALKSDEGAGRAAQGETLEERVAGVESLAKKTSEAVGKQLGSITFGGDLRFRYESFYGQQNALASSDDPTVLGNPLSTRQRLRVRARFGAKGKIGDQFEWGIRLASGTFADVLSSNQTLTDFFSRKNFALDLAYISYKPWKRHGFVVQAGKFDTPWLHTEMTWDADINPEGVTESYTRESKTSTLKTFNLVAWQLPMLERNSAFVLGADGRVDLGASGRAGRDLALYGAQAQADLSLSKHVSLRLSAADLYFSGTQFITPAQVFGANIQFPVTFTIPASGTTPARTVTTQVSIPRDLLVGGNANLGVSLGSTNAVNRDGRLASGYNLVDLIGRLELSHHKSWPVVLLLNYVVNTQARDFVTAGAGGADLFVRNDEGSGYWAEFQVGRDALRLKPEDSRRGDLAFNYTFTRVEKDAILAPFNGSDLGQFTDMRVHRFNASYALDPRVVVALTAFLTQRPNGVLGVFGATPPGSFNRTQTRLQFDTTFRF